MNALVALAWGSHVHHAAMVDWLDDDPGRAWATCPVTEAGFVRFSSNARALGAAATVGQARTMLRDLRGLGRHRFLTNDISMTDESLPPMAGHRQVTDGLLLGVARRHGLRLVTFDAALAKLGRESEVELLVR